MGRLTLNVLLSFAQFEREVTGERIRDKIAASKKKGMWMGGSVPLGYDVVDKKLVVNAVEAETVRHMYQRYVEVRSLVDLAAELASAGVVSKQRVCRSGRIIGGTPYWVGGLANLLRNRTYLGQILHKGTVHQGEHDAIIIEALWEAAQATFAANRNGRKSKRTIVHKSLLTGLLYDPEGRQMIADHAVKGQRRYRYYMSRRDGSAPGAMRIPAGEIERLVLSRLASFLESGAQLDSAMTERAVDPLMAAEAIRDCADLAGRLEKLPTVEQSDIIAKLVRRIDIKSDRVAIAISAAGLTTLRGNSTAAAIADSLRPIEIAVTVAFKKRGVELRMVVSDVEQRERRDPALIALIARSFAVRQTLEAGAYRTMEDCAAALGHTTPHLARLLRISYLSPALVADVLDGRQPVELTAATLRRRAMIGLSWSST